MTTVIHCKGDKTSYQNYVYIGRPGPWGNPFMITAQRTRAQVITDFEAWFRKSPDPEAQWMREHIHELKGKDLGCWCKPHAWRCA